MNGKLRRPSSGQQADTISCITQWILTVQFEDNLKRPSKARIPEIANLTCIITRWRRQCLANFNSVRKSHRMSVRLVLQGWTLVIRPAVAHRPKSVHSKGFSDIAVDTTVPTNMTYAPNSEIHKKIWTESHKIGNPEKEHVYKCFRRILQIWRCHAHAITKPYP